MAGREKISAKKIHNMGYAKLEHACSEIVRQYMANDHPLSLTKDDEATMHALANLSPQEWGENLMGFQRLLVSQLIHKSIKDIKHMKAGQSHIALKYAMDSLREMQGDSSQHVTQARRGMTAEEAQGILNSLPKKAKQDD
jgi:hypothetical protein